MRFSVIVVCLNPGEKLNKTLESILNQEYEDYEILIKDGMSKDGSIEAVCDNSHIIIERQKDSSIYDAMNQATQKANGDYYIFMNCGDLFAHSKVLSDISDAIDKTGADILYGDMKREGHDEIIPSPGTITDFVCYRNIPCHQVCFYNKRLFEKRGYDTKYPVRADYEHFLWCKYKDNASFAYVNTIVAIYEGEGFSETGNNEKAAKKEHKKITKMYLGSKCIKYRFIMIITLQPLRKWMAGSKLFSGIYQKIKRGLYGR